MHSRVPVHVDVGQLSDLIIHTNGQTQKNTVCESLKSLQERVRSTPDSTVTFMSVDNRYGLSWVQLRATEKSNELILYDSKIQNTANSDMVLKNVADKLKQCGITMVRDGSRSSNVDSLQQAVHVAKHMALHKSSEPTTSSTATASVAYKVTKNEPTTLDFAFESDDFTTEFSFSKNLYKNTENKKVCEKITDPNGKAKCEGYLTTLYKGLPLEKVEELIDVYAKLSNLLPKQVGEPIQKKKDENKIDLFFVHNYIETDFEEIKDTDKEMLKNVINNQHETNLITFGLSDVKKQIYKDKKTGGFMFLGGLSDATSYSAKLSRLDKLNLNNNSPERSKKNLRIVTEFNIAKETDIRAINDFR